MYRIRIAVILVLGAVAVPGPQVLAQDGVPRVTLAEALAAFAEHSLALGIARSQADEAAGMARAYRRYANPAFTLVREDLGSGEQQYWETTAGVAQQLEWPGRTSARGRVATHMRAAALARSRADSIRLAHEVREAYVRAWLAEETGATALEAAAVIRTVAEAAERRLEEGDISAYEVRRLRLASVRAEQEVADAALEARAARRRLAVLMGSRAGTEEVGPGEGIMGVPPAVGPVAALEAVAGRADVEAAARELDAARARVAVAATGWVPDPTLGLGYKDQADGFSGAAVTVNLPLPVFDQGGGARDGAAAREAAAAYRHDLARRLAEIDLRDALDRHTAARARLEMAGDMLLADAEALLATARAAYAEGEMTLLELLDAAGAFRDARVSALSLRSAAWVAYYDLMRAMGRSPGEGR